MCYRLHVENTEGVTYWWWQYFIQKKKIPEKEGPEVIPIKGPPTEQELKTIYNLLY